MKFLKPVFNINSRTILPLTCAYIVFTGVVLIVFFRLTQNALKKEGLKDQLDMAFRNIENGAPLHNVMNNNAFHANYYLSKQLNALDTMAPGRYLEAKIIAEVDGSEEKLGTYVDTYAHWMSKHSMLPSACLRTYDRFYSSEDSMALFDFRSFITVDDCYPTDIGSREMSYLVVGMFLISLLMVLPFKILSHFFTALRRVEDFIGTRDIRLIESIAEQIRIEEIRTLFLRATKMQGESVYHYQSTMKDVKHNILRIILHFEDGLMRMDGVYNSLFKKFECSEVLELANISSELKVQLQQLKTANSHLDESRAGKKVEREFISAKHFIERIKTLLATRQVVSDLPSSNIHFNFELLEPALLNISSNARAYGVKCSVEIKSNENSITLKVRNRISFWIGLMLSLAKITSRIDLVSKDKGVYKKIIGREGLGLNMVKKSALALGGKMIMEWTLNEIIVGIQFPVRFSQIIVGVKGKKLAFNRKKINHSDLVIYFRNQENVDEAIRLGLEKYIKSKDDLEELLKKAKIGEIIVDHDIEWDRVYFDKIRKIKNRNLLHGIAQNLQQSNESTFG